MNKIVTSSLLVLSLVFFNSCKEGNASEKVKKENIVTAKKRDVEISKGSAEIEFDITEYDFGTVNEGEIVEAKFMVTNSGKTDLVISNVQPSCGCTVPVWPREPVAPGESGVIDVKFNSKGKKGKQSKKVTLTTNMIPSQIILMVNGL